MGKMKMDKGPIYQKRGSPTEQKRYITQQIAERIFAEVLSDHHPEHRKRKIPARK